MFWETLWALVLGFTLSGFVQAFISKEQMRAKLGNHRPAAVGRAAGYGMVSSSCSYAASAMSKSLFAKGADFVSSMVFMIASTNLVVELGIVMLVLLGWQFMAAEFVGGPIMIVLLALSGGFVFSRPLVDAARRRLANPHAGGHDHTAMSGVSEEQQTELDRTSWSKKLHSRAAWADASSYAKADVTMLRKELVIGYVVAGFLATLVPRRFWNVLFIHGHGFWTSAENAVVGPLIAVISWVCSIGNVPLAAALWSGGISFGGVIAFIFADLIAMPLILIYRKFYGNKLTLRLVGLFYAVMAIAGLLTEGVFRLFHLVPTTRRLKISSVHFEWNYTSYLNIIFIAVAIVVWWLARHQSQFGGGQGYAIDPVCSMQVRVNDAPAESVHENHHYYFCSDRCRERFEERPERYVAGATNFERMDSNEHRPDNAKTAVDPVCGMTIDKATAAAQRNFEGTNFWFCNVSCAETFDTDPGRYPVSH
ncbi:MAG TPA: permease [Acidimicrobiales bacterium]|nr:permease [Acidimicrobiales bacterium]